MYHALKLRENCEYDMMSLGEIMLRLDPGDCRVRNARSFRVWEGGGEYNVARGLRRCYGMKTAALTALADNDVGRLIEDFMLQGGVDTSFIKWAPFDGIGYSVRNGLNFTERGFGIRASKGISDRGHSAASQICPEDFDWDGIFGERGVRWLHSGGIFAALSESTARTVIEAFKKAKEHGVIVSYDLNYRPSLWEKFGGKERAREVNREIAAFVDVMIGNEEDFNACLGYDVAVDDKSLRELNEVTYAEMLRAVCADYPNIKVAGTTLRGVKSANVNSWTAMAYSDGRVVRGIEFPELDIYDRVGGGDSFAAGLIYGLMTGDDLKRAVDLGTAGGALAMTTPGDTSMATLAEIEKVARGGSARIVR